ncbi:hypothetical protein Mal64_08720 [Pseudobythopirellula maris]|uniref:Uncharacterized protein n=1 Tax=Pseudobythopirellula maris TaxID=2527991 RepID=A0A5C5ZSG0_9BACT|nr:hypothetical protein [Pseudobythopirellula maris]TWT90482.1 hypothetical protein Mal64_08720 [Pseudobythopirellula maris]
MDSRRHGGQPLGYPPTAPLEEPQGPRYRPGTPLFDLWVWSCRLRRWSNRSHWKATEYDGSTLDPDDRAAAALDALANDWPGLVEEVRLRHRNSSSHWRRALETPDEQHQASYLDAVELMWRRIRVVCDLIAEQQDHAPRETPQGSPRPK